MSRTCPITGKHPMYGNNRSHSLRATRRRWNVNLQKTTMIIDGKKTTVRLSASALRTLRKNNKKAVIKPAVAPAQAAAPVAEVKPAVAEVKPAEVKPVEEKPAEEKPAKAKTAAKKPAKAKAEKAEDKKA
jgi:large subunit ribosomal protein L28